MEKTTLSEIKSDVKYKRDSLHLAHEELKRQGDYWNKIIIFVSLGSSLFESTKMKMGWDYPSLGLIPIILSSFVAAISALIKFKRYNEQQEVLIQSCTVLTSTLNKARNCTEVDEDLLREYHDALELLETSLYPDVRKRFLKASQKNLISIISNEDEYFDLIEKARNGEDISDYRSNPSSENVKTFQAVQTNPMNNLEPISENTNVAIDANAVSLPDNEVQTTIDVPDSDSSVSNVPVSTSDEPNNVVTQPPTETDTINLEVTDQPPPNTNQD